MENVAEDLGPSQSYCGYCNSPSGFYTHGMRVSSLTVSVYQDLLDTGWRRSGTYLYKPDLKRMCCPLYTIRLPVERFIPSRSQQKTLRRFQKYLDGGPLNPEHKEKPIHKKAKLKEVDGVVLFFKMLLEECLVVFVHQEGLPDMEISVSVSRPQSKQKGVFPATTFVSSPLPLSLYSRIKKCSLDCSKKWTSPQEVAFQLSEIFQIKKNCVPEKLNLSERQVRTVGSFLKEVSVHAVNGYLNFTKTEDMSGLETEISSIMSTCILAEDPDSDIDSQEIRNSRNVVRTCNLPTEFCKQINKSRKFVMLCVPSKFIEEEFELYKKYQMAVHGDLEFSITELSYCNFLVNSPLQSVSSKKGEAANHGFGSFHIQYRIDNKLVAVGVVDILPRCLSSKYLFWDPDFASLSLGRISVLLETKWVQDSPLLDLKYYYMGYYIHSCPKMRYKGSYHPSQLLCPESYLWVELTKEVEESLDRAKYVHLARVEGAKTEPNQAAGAAGTSGDPISETELLAQPIFLSGRCITLGEYIHRVTVDIIYLRDQRRLREFNEIITAVKKEVESWRMLLKEVGKRLVFKMPSLYPSSDSIM